MFNIFSNIFSQTQIVIDPLDIDNLIENDATLIEAKNFNRKKLLPGDIIWIKRIHNSGIPYKHFGVYVSDSEVIHYTSDDSDIGTNNKITKTSLTRFLRGEQSINFLIIPDIHTEPQSVNIDTSKNLISPNILALLLAAKKIAKIYTKTKKLIQDINYKKYDRPEIIDRARSRIGENNYRLIFNNCEHFALWCATGINESHQVNRLVNAILECELTKNVKVNI